MNTLSLAETRAVAASFAQRHKRLFGLALGLQIIVGALFLFFPSFSLRTVGLSEAMGPEWPSIWGATLIFVTVMQIPGALSPLTQRYANVIAVLGRAMMVLTFLWHGGPFVIFAIFDLVFGALIFLGFRRAVLAELQTRP
ncbi:MAG: hypothetical protein AAGC82_10540 [Pseudomonadota bacterium]